MMGFLQVVLILAAFIAAFAGISLFLYFCLSAIKNHFINKIVLVIFCILFLPCMLFLWSTGKITEKEKVLFPFLSFNLRARSRIVLFATAVYAIIYYALFQMVFS